jgi:hypothetical protein
MSSQNEIDAAARTFGLKMLNSIEEGTITEALTEAKLDMTDPVLLFRSGYLAGANDSFLILSPRALQMGKVLKTLYVMLGEMSARHEDLAVLNDLTALHCEIAQYLVTESDAILATSRAELVRKSCVPDEYIDNEITMSEIPHAQLVTIGRNVAMQNSERFAVFAVAGGTLGSDGTPMTLEQLAGKVERQEIIPDRLAEKNMENLLAQYGAAQIRATRRAYAGLEKSLGAYKMAHERDATQIADSLYARMKTTKA